MKAVALIHRTFVSVTGNQLIDGPRITARISRQSEAKVELNRRGSETPAGVASNTLVEGGARLDRACRSL